MGNRIFDLFPLFLHTPSGIVRQDELWHFVNGKKKTWIWRAINSVSYRSLGGQLGGRGDACCQRLITKVDEGTYHFITDEWPSFFRLFPEDRHFYGKDLTFPMEQTNRDIHHQLAHHLQESHTLAQYMKPILSIFS